MGCKLLTVSHKYFSWTCGWLADIVCSTATLSGVFASKHKATCQVNVRAQHYLSTFIFCSMMLRRHLDDRPLMKGMIPGIAMILHTESFWSVQWHVHSQATVKTHTEVVFKTWQLKAKACNGHCKHTHKLWLLLNQATRHCTNFLHIRCIAVELFSCNMFDCFQT